MEKQNKNMRKYIDYFNPDVVVLSDAHQDLCFRAGKGYENFDEFIKEEALEYTENGDGVTYLVFNIRVDDDGKEISRELVSYYTLSATSIPYIDRIRLDEDEARETGQEFNEEICGIPALEIKIFAVDENYQDVFFQYDGEELPISAWIIRYIIDTAQILMNTVMGFKALFLHAIPDAEEFYSQNGFYPMKINMQPLHCIDSEYTAMYLALKEIHMNYDD